jgi:hypothetical protein
VKFPFPPTKNLQGDKPAFPQAGGRPAYKGKASPATGAKNVFANNSNLQPL